MYSGFPGDDALRIFELTLFSFITGNGDMHLKNFSLMKNKNGHFRLTPAYDLLPTRLLLSENEDPEELALNLGGKKSRFKLKDFVEYGQYLSIPDKVIDKTIEQFHRSHKTMVSRLEKSFLTQENMESYCRLIETRLRRLR